MKKIIALAFILVGCTIIAYVIYRTSKYSDATRTFSEYTLLNSSWEKYKAKFINSDGRVVDPSQNNITTSEGESYALLRAVWIDDKTTFDSSWAWTKNNLKLEKKSLFGWRWGKKSDGTYGFMNSGDANSASDADSDIALALILASRRWKDNAYLEEAKPILNDMWETETAEIKGNRYFIAGNWAQDNEKIILNPSYFAPYAWRIFATVDKKHDWLSLIDPAYDILNRSGQLELRGQKGIGLPPDWIMLTKDGVLKEAEDQHLSINYTFDAMRTPWRIALDYQWNKEQKAYDYLNTSYSSLKDQYENQKIIYASYSHDGKPLQQIENASMYATSLGYFTVIQPDLAKKIYDEKIISLYSNAQDNFNKDLPYYEQNWLWFGAALFNKYLIPFN